MSAVFPWVSLPLFVVGGRLMHCALLSGVVWAELRDPRLQLDTLVPAPFWSSIGQMCVHTYPTGVPLAPSPAGPH